MTVGRGTAKASLWPSLILLILLAGLLSACALRASGQELVQEQCTRCHTLAPIEVTPHTRVEWESIVYKMIEHGAALNDSQVQRVVDYLAQEYGPGSAR